MVSANRCTMVSLLSSMRNRTTTRHSQRVVLGWNLFFFFLSSSEDGESISLLVGSFLQRMRPSAVPFGLQHLMLRGTAPLCRGAVIWSQRRCMPAWPAGMRCCSCTFAFIFFLVFSHTFVSSSLFFLLHQKQSGSSGWSQGNHVLAYFPAWHRDGCRWSCRSAR